MKRHQTSLGVGLVVVTIALSPPVASAQQICGEWTEVDAPAAATTAVTQVTALSANDAWALNAALGTIHWDGTAWSVVIPPDVPGATQVSRHGGLAAAGECDVWAVGSVYDGQVPGPFIERLQAGGGGVSATPVLDPGVAFLEVSPNPIRHSAKIRFAIPGGVLNRARIYDVRGRPVRTLFPESTADERLFWDGRDDSGGSVPGGVYFLGMESSDNRILTQKLTVVR